MYYIFGANYNNKFINDSLCCNIFIIFLYFILIQCFDTTFNINLSLGTMIARL